MTRAIIGSLLLVILLMYLVVIGKIPLVVDHTLHCACYLFLFSISLLIYMMFYRDFVLMGSPLVMSANTSAKLLSLPRICK